MKTYQEMPPEVLVEETIKEFGYNPNILKPWSRKRVVAKCFITGKIARPSRASLNTNKSVIETGHFTTHGANSKINKGRKHKSKTILKMKISQQKRRLLELEEDLRECA